MTDWFEVGRMDGMQGRPRTAFQNRAKPCLKQGVNADRQAYYRGHDLGLSSRSLRSRDHSGADARPGSAPATGRPAGDWALTGRDAGGNLCPGGGVYRAMTEMI